MAAKIICGERILPLDEMHERAHRAAAGLRTLGVGEQDAIAVFLRNDFPFVEAAYAANRLGAHLVPINWHFSASEASYVLEDSGAKVVIAHTDLAEKLEGAVPTGCQLFLVETPPEIRDHFQLGEDAITPRTDAPRWGRWLEEYEPLEPAEVSAPGSMIYTSGTTGRPKGVRRQAPSPEEAQALGEIMEYIMPFDPDGAVALVTAPLYHSTPNGFFRRAIDFGADLVLEPRFDPERYLALIDRHHVTHAYAVATMFIRMLRLPEEVRSNYDVSSLKVVVHGAAPTPPEVKRRIIDWFGPVLVEHYGSTELGAVVACNAHEWLDHVGTVGKPLPHVDITVLDEEKREQPPGEPGEIYARMKYYPDFTYQNDPEKRAAMEHEGLWTAGDIGYLDEDGFLYLSDRKRDMIISGGVNIYPLEIEAELHQMPEILDCAVFGIPDDEFGEAVAAVVLPQPDARLTDADVRAFLKPRIAGYKMPKVIDFREDLPREDSGKIFKRKIRDEYWQAAGRNI
ncbi:MAG: acyl-CoA synthetase [Pseudomonadota bacterium]